MPIFKLVNVGLKYAPLRIEKVDLRFKYYLIFIELSGFTISEDKAF